MCVKPTESNMYHVPSRDQYSNIAYSMLYSQSAKYRICRRYLRLIVMPWIKYLVRAYHFGENRDNPGYTNSLPIPALSLVNLMIDFPGKNLTCLSRKSFTKSNWKVNTQRGSAWNRRSSMHEENNAQFNTTHRTESSLDQNLNYCSASKCEQHHDTAPQWSCNLSYTKGWRGRKQNNSQSVNFSMTSHLPKLFRFKNR